MEFFIENLYLIFIIIVSGVLILYPSLFFDKSLNIKVSDAVLLMNREPSIIIDVREAEKFEAGHILNAINIPFQEFFNDIDSLNINRKKRILIYCNSGNRAGKVIKILRKNGFKSAITIDGGLNEWQKCHLPVTQINKL